MKVLRLAACSLVLLKAQSSTQWAGRRRIDTLLAWTPHMFMTRFRVAAEPSRDLCLRKRKHVLRSIHPELSLELAPCRRFAQRQMLTTTSVLTMFAK